MLKYMNLKEKKKKKDKKKKKRKSPPEKQNFYLHDPIGVAT